MKKFLHSFSFYFRILMRTKDQLFWCLLFPILLSTMFYFAFSGFADSSDFSAIPVAVSSEISLPDQVKDIFNENLEDFLDVTWAASSEEADDLLREKNVSGAIHLTRNLSMELTVSAGSSLEASILESLVENYNMIRQSFIRSFEEGGFSGVIKTVRALPGDLGSYVSHSAGSGDIDKDLAKINFYSLIGMFCLFAGMGGMTAVILSQANLSPLGLRTSLTGASHAQVLGGFLLGAFLVQYVCILIGIGWMRFVLKVDFGHTVFALLLTAAAGCLTGVCLGFLVGSIGGMKESTKNAILMVVIFGRSASAGLFGTSATMQLEHTLPLLNRINPVTMVTDAMYALALNGGSGRVMRDIFWMLLMAALFFTAGVLLQRRKQFESL